MIVCHTVFLSIDPPEAKRLIKSFRISHGRHARLRFVDPKPNTIRMIAVRYQPSPEILRIREGYKFHREAFTMTERIIQLDTIV
ncbi:MAG TPA: hypothetical protein VF020_24550 [Chthoniobacterales bacterium]